MHTNSAKQLNISKLTNQKQGIYIYNLVTVEILSK